MPKEKPAPVEAQNVGGEAVESDPAPCEELPQADADKPARVKG